MSLYTYYIIYQFLTRYLWLLFVIRHAPHHKMIYRMKHKRCSQLKKKKRERENSYLRSKYRSQSSAKFYLACKNQC